MADRCGAQPESPRGSRRKAAAPGTSHRASPRGSTDQRVRPRSCRLPARGPYSRSPGGATYHSYPGYQSTPRCRSPPGEPCPTHQTARCGAADRGARCGAHECVQVRSRFLSRSARALDGQIHTGFSRVRDEIMQRSTGKVASDHDGHLVILPLVEHSCDVPMVT